MAAGSYKMSRPLNLVTLPKTSKLVSEFIAYCQSADVHDLIRAISLCRCNRDARDIVDRFVVFVHGLPGGMDRLFDLLVHHRVLGA